MKIEDITMELLQIPFRCGFQHASAERDRTEAVLVRARGTNGLIGLGEGCPRRYVTGESIKTCLEFFESHRGEFCSMNSLAALEDWIRNNTAIIDRNPAAFCAVELALLDLYAASAGISREELLGVPKLRAHFEYSAILGTQNSKLFGAMLDAYLKLGMNDFKVKLFGNRDIDAVNLGILATGLDVPRRVRFDANNAWQDADEVLSYLADLPVKGFAIEEPVSAGNFRAMGAIARHGGMQIILDESFLKMEDFDRLEECPDSWIINLRVSKLGGLIRSLGVARRAEQLGIPIIVGAQVGETAILTRAGMTLAMDCPVDMRVAQEGAFGTWLLEWDVETPSVRFGVGGVLDATGLPATHRRLRDNSRVGQ